MSAMEFGIALPSGKDPDPAFAKAPLRFRYLEGPLVPMKPDDCRNSEGISTQRISMRQGWNDTL